MVEVESDANAPQKTAPLIHAPVEGLVTEYDYSAVALRNVEIQLIPTLTELESIEIEGFGTMEAFVTSGGTSMAPYSVQGKVTNYEYKTIRFPGHCQIMKVMKDFGLWREDEVEVRGTKIKPKDVWCRVFGEELMKGGRPRGCGGDTP